jgi:TatD DNase family protein
MPLRDAPFTKDTRNTYSIMYIENIVSELSYIKKLEKNEMFHILKRNFIRLLK